MTYNDWNNLLGDRLFKAKRAQQEVFLFLNAEQVTEAGRNMAAKVPDAFDYDEEEGETLTDEIIWRSFLTCMRNGPPGSGSRGVGLLQRAYNCYSNWQRLCEAGETLGSRVLRQSGEVYQVRYPVHLSYLLLFTMPFGGDVELANTRGYYKSLNKWLHDNDLIPTKAPLNTPDFSALGVGNGAGWRAMWQSVGAWTLDECKSQLGEVHNRANNWPNWPYVGWPLAQCLLQPATLSRLPLFFGRYNLLPGSTVTNERLRALLIADNTSGLELPHATRQELQKDSELGQAVVDMVQNVFSLWTGSTNRRERVRYSWNRTEQVEHRGKTYASLLPFLPLHICETEDLTWYFRLHIKTALPEELVLTGPGVKQLAVQPETNEWSQEIPGILASSQAQIYQDTVNDWQAVAQLGEIQVFIPGGRYGFYQYWAPIKALEHGTEMLLLCRENRAAMIEHWGKNFGPSNFADWSHFNNLPAGYCLFWLADLPADAAGLPGVEAATESLISVEGGLDFGHRTYLDELPPSFRVINGKSNWRLALIYGDGGESLTLLPDAKDKGLWHLPAGVRVGSRFSIVIEGEANTNNLSYGLKSGVLPTHCTAPSRGRFGQIVDPQNAEIYYDGSCLGGNSVLLHQLHQRQTGYVYHFTPSL
ncbi:hypothetical protein J7E24_10120 [Hymenobacter sp. ISL-91]|uniref:hypothetical protein n=1 Tax=Hymenobacter sp. ISL-91 TaxID=2819151 RepID=UPI001BEC3845|nr:hypothetical protein [Hymenobacter sp. ISL-91]MBT2558140.1 hypothetical protein [Hymenobacter sp. ISL-91]